MVIVNDPVDSATKDVMFYFMFTDDGLQDEWAVACAKMIMYTETVSRADPGAMNAVRRGLLSNYRTDLCQRHAPLGRQNWPLPRSVEKMPLVAWYGAVSRCTLLRIHNSPSTGTPSLSTTASGACVNGIAAWACCWRCT